MTEGAKVAQGLGADIIDINMGCPARQVTGGLSGSALMRNLDHALTLIEATIAAVQIPVMLKMRLGWDDKTQNAPELAKRAEAAGIALITVHGRTRCQFYTGKADWKAIRAVREQIKIPLIANGDCDSVEDARTMMTLSRADGVMIGRAAYGRPWWPGFIAEGLKPGTGQAEPNLAKTTDIILNQQQETLQLYGAELGNKTFRKHLGWTILRLFKQGYFDEAKLIQLRGSLLSETNNSKVSTSIADLFHLCAQHESLAA